MTRETPPDAETALRQQIADLQAQLQMAIPALPTEHDGVPISWQKWEEAPVIIAHIPNECAQCDHPGPQLLTFGLAGPGRPTKRFRAFRCRACQEMTVYRTEHPRYGPPATDYIEIAYHPPRTSPVNGGEPT